MSNAEDLDEALRAKLRAAAQLDPTNERPERHAAWTAALVREQRVARQRRWALGSALSAGFVVAAAALLLFFRAPNSEQRVANAGLRCALPQGVTVQRDAAGTQRIVLGRFGALAATPDSKLRVEGTDPCLLALQLERGELAGDLSQLKPAVLRVRTPQATVVVRGTRFSVRADDELEVVLLSGRVEVESETTRVLEPRHALRKRGAAWQLRATQEAEAQRIAGLLAGKHAAPRVTAAAGPSADELGAQNVEHASETPRLRVRSGELLARAESARRQGLVDRARGLYAQASARGDADAEVALLRWVRLELSARAFNDAAKVLAQHRQRFSAGKLKAEAAWLGVVLLRDRGDANAARDAARAFVASFPSAPQADAARALLHAPP